MYNFEIESIYPEDVSFKEFKNIICKKIARIIISSINNFSNN